MTHESDVSQECHKSYVLSKSHGQAEQGSYLVAHSCAARFVYLSASHFCSVKNGTLQFWNSILLQLKTHFVAEENKLEEVGIVEKIADSLYLPIPLVPFCAAPLADPSQLFASVLLDHSTVWQQFAG